MKLGTERVPAPLAMDSSWARWLLGGYLVVVVLVMLYAEWVEPMPGRSVPNEALVMAA